MEDKDITIVTAFFDIGRQSWQNNEHNRNLQYYTESFLNFLNYPYNMVCYIDDRYIDEIVQYYNNSIYKNKTFIPINQSWLNEYIHAWQQIEWDRRIMNDDKYKNLLKTRLLIMYPNGIPATNVKKHLFPENEYPEYNVVQHSKVDFIAHAIDNKYINTPYTVWCDFGYFKSQCNNLSEFPKNTLDVNLFTENKITFIIRQQINVKFIDMYYMLVHAQDVFTGTFYGGPTKLMHTLQTLYHDCVNELYNNCISDDDQHIYLRCYIKNPNLFDLFLSPTVEWPKGLSIFQKK